MKINTEDKKLPWFKFYASDFAAHTVGLTNEEVGIYVKLLAYTWAYGPQPNDLKVINSIVQGGDVTELVLARFFETNEQGKLCEPSLEVLRNESIEVAEMNRKRTAAATAKRKEQPLRDRDDNVTWTEIEVEVEVEKDSQSDSNPKLDVKENTPARAASPLAQEKPLDEIPPRGPQRFQLLQKLKESNPEKAQRFLRACLVKDAEQAA